MAQTVSQMLGMMVGPDGNPRRAYRALVPLACDHCGAIIEQGTVFARRSGKMNVPQAFPHCRECLPLRPI